MFRKLEILVIFSLIISSPLVRAQYRAPQVLSLDLSDFQSCVVTTNGVDCWGSALPLNDPLNEHHEEWKYIPNQPRQIATNDDICILDKDGVKCWGEKSLSEVPPLSNVHKISLGIGFACALDDISIKCWGNVPDNFKVPELKNPREMSIFGNYVCAIDDDGIKCWGTPDDDRPVITPPNFKNLKSISLGERHTCALDQEEVKCWGDNSFHQINVPNLKNPKQISAGNLFTCALDDEGVKCWGSNSHGQLDIPPLTNPELVEVGRWHACAVDQNGIKCWGDNKYDQLFDNRIFQNIHKIITKKDTTCGLDDDSVKCWPGKDRKILSPKLNKPLSFDYHSGYSFKNYCAIDLDGVKCWNWKDTDSKYTLINVPKLNNPTQVSVGESHFCALDIINPEGTNTVKCWGNNDFGQLNVPKLSFPYKVVSTDNYSCALDALGIKCWGSIENERFNKKSNERFSKYKDAKFVALNKFGACLIISNEVKCWRGAEEPIEFFSRSFSKPRLLSASSQLMCVTDESGTFCTAIEPLVEPFEFILPSKNPKDISVGTSHLCMLENNEVKCFGQSPGYYRNILPTPPRNYSPR